MRNRLILLLLALCASPAIADACQPYRDVLQEMIAALPRKAGAEQCRADAIACNAVIDGLWLEGSALPDAFQPGELEEIGLAAVGSILGVKLADALPGAERAAGPRSPR